MSTFRLPEGILKNGQPFFDPARCRNDHLGVSQDVIPFDHIKRKANVILAKYGFEPISNNDLEKDINYISSEVGDDELTVSDSKPFIAIQAVFHELFGMKVSVEDTCISNRFGNFAEDLVVLPDGYGQTYLNARKTSRYKDMSFIDIPKLRLAIDIRPMRMNHSSTNDGKAQMIGSRQQWIPVESGFRGQYEIFNLFQDINLGLHRDRKFPYLPSSLGGYGKEPPFRNYMNLERFMKAYKQGSHSELIRNIVRRTSNYLDQKSKGTYPEKDPLLSHIVRFQSSFHDWIKGKSVYAPVTWYDIPQSVGKHRAAKHGDSSVKDEVIGRLLSEKRLVTENQLQIAVEHNELCKALLGSVNMEEFKSLREEARTRFSNLSIFTLESYGMIKELHLDQSNSKSHLSIEELTFFYKRVAQTRGNLRWIVGEEFVYWPEAMDEIYKQGPMKAKFEMFPLSKVGNRTLGVQRSEFKSDMEDTEDLHSLDHLEEWLRKGGRGDLPDTQLVNDDEPIIASVRKQMYNLIITDDLKLCKEANYRTRNVVVRIPCSWYYKCIYFGTKHYTEYLQEVIPGVTWTEHEDSGSLKAFEEAYFRDGVPLARPVIQKFNIWKKPGQKDKEDIKEILEFSDEPEGSLKSLVYDVSNVSRLKHRVKW